MSDESGPAPPALAWYYESMEHFSAPGLEPFEKQWHFSHAVAARGLLLLSGVTGTDIDGVVSSDSAEQFDQAFVHLRRYLEAAGASIADLAEITSYHVDLRQHLDASLRRRTATSSPRTRPGRRSVSRS